MIYDVMCDVKTKENKLMNFCELYEKKIIFWKRWNQWFPKYIGKDRKKIKLRKEKKLKEKKQKIWTKKTKQDIKKIKEKRWRRIQKKNNNQ